MKLLVASSNPHKIEEIAAVFARCASGAPGRLDLQLVSLTEAQVDVPEPVEDKDTFEGNAALKARYYALASGLACIADDSGLEVDALGGAPGVLSARFSGQTGERAQVDLANNRLLIEKLQGVPAEQRSARFVCAMALLGPDRDQPIAQARGCVEGRILLPDEAADPSCPERGRGPNGFGYDPLFLLPERNKTTAELSPEEKNAISHRGAASRLLWNQLARVLA